MSPAARSLLRQTLPVYAGGIAEEWVIDIMRKGAHRGWWFVALALLSACTAPQLPGRKPTAAKYQGFDKSPQALVRWADQLHGQASPSLAVINRGQQALGQALTGYPDRYEVRWRLARGCFLLTQATKNAAVLARRAREGAANASEAMRLAPKRVEGYYYYALNLGKLAQVRGKLSLVKKMVAAGKRAAGIDAAYDGAGPLVFLGKLYLSAPGWPISVGDVEKAIGHLERALALSPRPLTRVFLGQAYLEDDRPQDAKAQLERALRAAKSHKLEAKWQKEAQQALERLR